jgi:endonuclease/exonuclease/phosphatase family metal-dependent hydrolase
MQEMRAWMKEFAIPKDEAVILSGDLNTEFQSDEFKTIFADNFVFKMKKQDFGTFSAGTNWLARADKYVAGRVYDQADDFDCGRVYIKVGSCAST